MGEYGCDPIAYDADNRNLYCAQGLKNLAGTGAEGSWKGLNYFCPQACECPQAFFYQKMICPSSCFCWFEDMDVPTRIPYYPESDFESWSCYFQYTSDYVALESGKFVTQKACWIAE